MGNFNFKNKYIRLLLILSTIICINIFFINPQVIFIPIIGLGIFLLIKLGIKRDKNTVIYMILLIVFQNITLILLSSFLNEKTSSIMILYKELLAYFTVAIYVVFKNGFLQIRKNKFIFLFMISIIISFFIGDASLYVKLISIRQMIIPIVAFVFGMSIDVSEVDLSSILKKVIYLGIFVCIFGIIETTILGDTFWVEIGIEKYMTLKGFKQWLYGTLPGNFYTSDIIKLTGSLYRRMASIFADPLLNAHFIVFCYTCLTFYENLIVNKIARIFTKILFLICILATFSKGAMLILLIVYLIIFYKKNKKLFYSLLACSGIALIYILKTDLLSTVAIHAGGLISNFKEISIFGKGVGMSGNYAFLYSNNPALAGTGESFIGILIGQLGLIGVVAFIGFNFNIIKNVYKQKDNSLKLIILSLLIGLLLESLLSESAISFIGSGIYFIFAGIAYSKFNKNSSQSIICEKSKLYILKLRNLFRRKTDEN